MSAQALIFIFALQVSSAEFGTLIAEEAKKGVFVEGHPRRLFLDTGRLSAWSWCSAISCAQQR
jgi:hypothetical protein